MGSQPKKSENTDTTHTHNDNGIFSIEDLSIESPILLNLSPAPMSAEQAIAAIDSNLTVSAVFSDYIDVLRHENLWGFRDNVKDCAIIPPYNKTDRFHHITKVGDDWQCDDNCDQYQFENGQDYCDHTLIMMLLKSGFISEIPVFDQENRGVCEHPSGDALQLYIGDGSGYRYTLLSVQYDDDSYSFVHQSANEQNVVCSFHGGCHCVCKRIVYTLIPDLVPKRQEGNGIEWSDGCGFVHEKPVPPVTEPISQRIIPTPKCDRTYLDSVPDQDEYDSIEQSTSVQLEYYPELKVCQTPDCGHEFELKDAHVFASQAKLYRLGGAYHVTTYSYICPHCHERYTYDGWWDKIFYYNKNTMVDHDVFLSWHQYRAETALTQFAYVTNMQLLYRENNSGGFGIHKIEFPCQSTFRKWERAFYGKLGYSKVTGCTGCKAKHQLPRNLSWDATAQVIQAKHICHMITPRETHRFNDVLIKMQSHIQNAQTRYLELKKLRRKLESYCIHEQIKIYKTDSNVNQRRQLLPGLVKCCHDNHQHKLANFLLKFARDRPEMQRLKQNKLASSIGDFLRSLSNNVVLDAIVPRPIADLICAYQPETWSTIQEAVRRWRPVLGRLLEAWDKSPIAVPTEFIELLHDVAEKSKKYIDDAIAHRRTQPAAPIAHPSDPVQQLFKNSAVTGVSYNEYTVQNTRPKYDWRSENKKGKTKESEANGDCNKYYHEMQDMSNGLVVFMCADHNEVVGWHILKNPESVDDAFSLMMMLYPGDEAPDHVNCDNACALHRYCIYREPGKFNKTIFSNDQFHSKGHKCGPYYNVKYWKDTNKKCPFRNSSKIESLNSKLDKSRISCGFMNLPSFAEHVTDKLEIASRKAINKNHPMS